MCLFSPLLILLHPLCRLLDSQRPKGARDEGGLDDFGVMCAV